MMALRRCDLTGGESGRRGLTSAQSMLSQKGIQDITEVGKLHKPARKEAQSLLSEISRAAPGRR